MAVRGLGKGLGALLGDTERGETQNGRDVTMINVDSLRANRYQPRKYFSTESLEELAASIKAQGVLQPILVRPGTHPDEYELVAGERRWRASKLAELRHIPAIIRDLGDKESLALALIENVQREDLNALEQAQALQQLQDEFQATQNELAERTGLSRPHIANLLRLLQLPEHMQKDIQEKLYTAGHGRVLAGITDPEGQMSLRDRIISDDLSVRESERHAAYWKEHGRFAFQARQEQEMPAIAKSERMVRFEEMIIREVGLRGVKLRGTEEKGSMTMRYGSKDELARLLKILGVDAS
ncbi:ParB/RepB/Spo0J family partition protein [Desulfonatronum sp. SC1]|uniref:ParB/RepB/Spo0J family partition protein n=1 Tax=Desulfonatronum sp. SC1 TaxID=2109626 RepID=UPI000D319C56|nr:ParB/RepB/Spo0J family partition protein [Desulfonatronum sp. SC1]PTN36523.1 chromosome partitioning protein ParB [Desulfonatronum sp. SC1]